MHKRAVLDSVGEWLAAFFGITTPRYQYVLDDLISRQRMVRQAERASSHTHSLTNTHSQTLTHTHTNTNTQTHKTHKTHSQNTQTQDTHVHALFQAMEDSEAYEQAQSAKARERAQQEDDAEAQPTQAASTDV